MLVKLKVEQRHIDGPIGFGDVCSSCPYAKALTEICKTQMIVAFKHFWPRGSVEKDKALQPPEMISRRSRFDADGGMEPHELDLPIPKEWLKDEIVYTEYLRTGLCDSDDCNQCPRTLDQASTVHRDVEDLESDTDPSGPIDSGAR